MKDYICVWKRLENEEEEKWKYYAQIFDADSEEEVVNMIKAHSGTDIDILNIEEGK